jgi:hypothetical protein
MDAPIAAHVSQDAVDEGAVDLVVGPGAGDGLCQGVLVVCQERLRERRCAFLGPRIGDVELVKGFADRRCRPDLYGRSCHLLDFVQQGLFALHHFLFGPLGPVQIDPYAAARHFHKVRQQCCLERPDILHVFLLDQGFEMRPKL